MRRLIFTLPLLVGLSAGAHAQCMGELKSEAAMRAAGIAVERVTPALQTNIMAHMKARDGAPEVTRIYFLTEGENHLMVFVADGVSENCVVFVEPVDDDDVKRLEAAPGSPA